MTIPLHKITEARKHLALGRSLEAAALIIGAKASDLDRALWAKIDWRNRSRKRPAGHQ